MMKERLILVVHTALEIADETSISDIESYCIGQRIDDALWWDTSRINEYADDREFINRAVKHLDLRERLEHHPDNNNLVRFIKQ